MSANLDLVRSICAAWERGDFRSASWAHSDIEFVMTDIGPEPPETSRGLADMRSRMRRYLSPVENMHIRALDFRELDREKVLVLAEYKGRGKASGLRGRSEEHTSEL